MRDDILNTHSSVFMDSLEHEVMQGSPMHIHLDAEKATPFRVLKSPQFLWTGKLWLTRK